MSRPLGPRHLLLLLRTRPPSLPITHHHCSAAAAAAAVFHPCASRRTYADRPPDSDAKPDFKSQLWQSTTERVQREKHEQARFARSRRVGTDARGLAFVTALLMGCTFTYYLGTLTAPPATEASTLPLERAAAPRHNLDEANLQAAWSDLRQIVGEAHVSTRAEELEAHAGSSWSSYAHGESDRPFCIVAPASTEEVSRVMTVLHARRIPVVPYAGGTSLEGHFASLYGGICIDFSRMDRILAVHAADLDCVVQPAVGWEELNERLAEEGLFFPPDPGPGALIGGMVGTGCSGTNAYRYGTMRDWVVNLTVVLADGSVLKTRQRPRKTAAGYDLTRLFVGSEGTLGLVTEATLKLTAAPRNARVAVATFPSVRAAAQCVAATVRAGVPLAAVELLDDHQMRCVNLAGSTSKRWAEAPTLFFKFAGTSPAAVQENIDAVRAHAHHAGSRSFAFARDTVEADELWSARKQALWSVMAASPYPPETTRVWTTDVAVPISRLPDCIEATRADMRANDLVGAIVGHVGDGNFHAIILYDAQTRTAVEGVVHRMVRRAIDMEGTATGEHGVGVVKRAYLPEEVGVVGVDAMRALKRAWDPCGLLNPGKVVQLAV